MPKKYFSSIDGLRTLAVLWVVIFHAERAWMPGGFIGVDVFFVISGFLITRNIAGELEAGNWSFSRFYLRRVARLFPALFVTIILTLVAAWFFLIPSDLQRIGQASIFTVLSLSNVFFWMESGYFGVAAESKLLLHTWSLSVEEQFYFVWPLLLSLLYRVRQLGSIKIGLIVVGLLSFLAALWMDNRDPTTAFFLTPFRAYQFAIGGLIGLMGPGRGSVIETASMIVGSNSTIVWLLLSGINVIAPSFSKRTVKPYSAAILAEFSISCFVCLTAVVNLFPLLFMSRKIRRVLRRCL